MKAENAKTIYAIGLDMISEIEMSRELTLREKGFQRVASFQVRKSSS